MSEANPKPECDCPPPAERVAESPADPRAQLLEMASRLARCRNPRLFAEYLRLRRITR